MPAGHYSKIGGVWLIYSRGKNLRVFPESGVRVDNAFKVSATDINIEANRDMKQLRHLKTILGSLTAVLALLALTSVAQAETKKETKAKPYTLDTCIVSDEKLDSDPGMKSYAFVHGDQEFKLCCKSCLKDFNKNPGKFVKKLKDAEAKKAKDKK